MSFFSSWEELFPYKPRDGQREMMNFVRNGLLNDQHIAIEAQNGFGKTITALTSSLSANYDRVIFCTRTHEQIGHIVDEMYEIKKKWNKLMAVVLGAKWRLCINPWNKTSKEIKCTDIEQRGNSYFCVFPDGSDDEYQELLLPITKPVHIPPILDIEQNRYISKIDGYCPYYLAKATAEVCDVVVTPYNFVFSLPQRRSFGLNISNSVIVVDEAHNLPSICRSLNTAKITLDVIKETVGEIKSFIGGEALHGALMFRNWFRNFPKNTSGDFKKEFMEKSFVYGNKLLQEMYKKGIKRKEIKSLIRSFERYSKDRPLFSDMYAFLSLLFKSDPNKGIVYMSKGTLCYTILDIRDTINDIIKRGSKFVFMSGTLSPIGSFKKEIGIDVHYESFGTLLPKNRFQVELIGELQNGSESTRITTKANMRYEEDVIMGYGKIISTLIKHIPNGSLVMFPSYETMDVMLMNWGINEIVNEKGTAFSNGINIYKEPRTNFNYMLNQYKQDAERHQASLFCVFRGKVTEGTDLPNKLCRGIFIIGIPFAAWGSPIIQGVIDYHNNNSSGSGQVWYHYDAITTASQGIGRGIRDPIDDFCKVFLLDDRYITRKSNVYDKLSDWIKNNVVNSYGSRLEDAERRTERFFRRIGDDIN